MVLNYARALLSYDERNRDAKRERWKKSGLPCNFLRALPTGFQDHSKNDQIK